jgi:hypothetical protein
MGESKTVSIADFQDYIQQRIDAHADRVSTHGLAPAPAVRDAVESAMTDVWNSLPSGVGGPASASVGSSNLT